MVLLAAAALPSAMLSADSVAERRVSTGVRIFRAMLAADLGLEEKRLRDGSLLLTVVYAHDRDRAEAVATELRGDSAGAVPIHDLPVRVEVTAADDLDGLAADRLPAGLFIAEPPSDEALHALIRFGIAHRVIVYSPFEGDVEAGVLGGLSIEAQVRPYVNESTLRASHITLKPFFLKVAKRCG